MIGHLAVGDSVRVTWRDAYYVPDRGPDSDGPFEDYLVRTYGEVVTIGPLFLEVAGEVLPDGHRAITGVPLAMIQQEVEKLGPWAP